MSHDLATEHVFAPADVVDADDEEEDLDCSDDYELVIELSGGGTSYTFEHTSYIFDVSRATDAEDPYAECGEGD